jgi:hypothetical protein
MRDLGVFGENNPYDATSTEARVSSEDTVSLISPRYYRILTIQCNLQGDLKLYIRMSPTSTLNLMDLFPQFYPSFLTKQFEQAAVISFAKDNIETWHEADLEAKMTCGSTMPTFVIPVRQFQPRGLVLKHHIQYHDLASRKAPSVPIGMLKLDRSVAQQCDEYVELIVRDHMCDR